MGRYSRRLRGREGDVFLPRILRGRWPRSGRRGLSQNQNRNPPLSQNPLTRLLTAPPQAEEQRHRRFPFSSPANSGGGAPKRAEGASQGPEPPKLSLPDTRLRRRKRVRVIQNDVEAAQDYRTHRSSRRVALQRQIQACKLPPQRCRAGRAQRHPPLAALPETTPHLCRAIIPA